MDSTYFPCAGHTSVTCTEQASWAPPGSWLVRAGGCARTQDTDPGGTRIPPLQSSLLPTRTCCPAGFETVPLENKLNLNASHYQPKLSGFLKRINKGEYTVQCTSCARLWWQSTLLVLNYQGVGVEARDKPMLVHWLDKKPLRVVMMLRRNLTAGPLQNQPHLFANTSNLLTKTININQWWGPADRNGDDDDDTAFDDDNEEEDDGVEAEEEGDVDEDEEESEEEDDVVDDKKLRRAAGRQGFLHEDFVQCWTYTRASYSVGPTRGLPTRGNFVPTGKGLLWTLQWFTRSNHQLIGNSQNL